MMGSSSRRPNSSGGLASSSSNNGGATISIRTPRRDTFNVHHGHHASSGGSGGIGGSGTSLRRHPLLVRFSPRVVFLALIAASCGLYTLYSSHSPFSSTPLSTSTFKDAAASLDTRQGYDRILPEMISPDTPVEQLRPHRPNEQKPLPHMKAGQQLAPLGHVGPAKETVAAAAAEVVENIHQIMEEEEVIQAAKTTLPPIKKAGPFDDYLCAGEEWQTDEDNVYTTPFRFHVYQNMPDHLAKDVVERAEHWWQPDNAANQFITEVQIYKYLAMHPCHTDDPLKADVFVVPAQTVSAIWLSREPGPNGEPPVKDEGSSYMKQVMTWIQSQRTGRRFDGRDHYVVSVPWWMGGRPYGGHVNLIGVEVPISFGTHQTFSDTLYNRASNDIIIPYPDPDSYAYYTDEMLDTVEKDLHMVFVGQNRVVAPVRQKVWDQLKAYNERRGDRPKALWHHLKNRDAIGDVKHKTARAIFGPVMKGDSYSSRRLFSLLFAGTIPVIICDYCMLPYQDMIDYSKFAIFLPESEVLDNPEYDIFDVLDSIPQKELDRLRKNGRIVKKHFVFHEGKPLPGDAFDLMVREMAFTHLRNRGLKAMMLRGYGEDDDRKMPLLDKAPMPGQELPFVGPGFPEAARKLKEAREVASGPLQEALPSDHVDA